MPLTHQTITPASTMGELLDLALIEGTITDFDGDAKTFTVSMPWGSVSGLPAFYHCEKETDTEKGYAAFREGDKILVLGSRNSHAASHIVGHADGKPRKCKSFLLVWARFGERTMASVFLWDLQENKIADLFLSGRKIDFPCDFSEISAWYEGGAPEVFTSEMETERIGICPELLAQTFRTFGGPVSERWQAYCTHPESCGEGFNVDIQEGCGFCSWRTARNNMGHEDWASVKKDADLFGDCGFPGFYTGAQT